MIVDKGQTWAVCVSTPKGSLAPNGKIADWKQNSTITVLAPTLSDAIAAVKKQWPDSDIWSINHTGGRDVVLICTEDP